MARNLLLGTALQTGLAFLSGVGAHPAHAQPAPNARPAGGTVVAGSASISRTPANTQINQSSPRAAIDWRSFDVGAQQSVTFAQPSASAVALNRVTGPDPSQIAGRIDANGQFILVNQSGVTFYKGAQVNAAGVMVSAANITNQNFMAGRLTFDQPGRANARIDNRGSITVREAGLAALVAPQVANSGVITARLGHVVLAGAKTATLDLYGDGLLSLDVSNQVTQAPVGADGKAATALVTNTGVIVADGGTVQLTARAADGLVQTLVQAGGTIQAASVGARTGVVALSGVGGSVVVEGQLSAPGSAPGTTGGAVQVVADHDVTVAASARIDASGQAGGGVVAIGTTLNRARDTKATAAMTAANTTIQAGARVSANAAGKGDGGRVIVLSKAATTVAAPIQAKGGPQGGNGGFVETSGKSLIMRGSASVDAGAQSATGKPGTWLLDPLDLDVVNGDADTNVDQSAGPPFTVTPNAAGAQISNITIENALDGLISEAGPTNVVLTTEGTTGTASGNITVDAGAPITWTSAATLTMNASGSILVNSAITNTTSPNAALTLVAGGGVSQSANGIISVSNLSVTATNDVNLNAANAVTTLAGSVLGGGSNFVFNNAAPLTVGAVGGRSGITTANGGITLTTTSKSGLTLAANLNAGGGTVTLNSAGGITQTVGEITAAVLSGSAAGATLLTSANNVAALGSFKAPGQLFVLDDSNAAALSVSDLTAGTIGLTAGSINIPGAITGDSVKLTATAGGISEAGGSIASPQLFGSATGAVDLTGTNDIETLSGFTSDKAFALTTNTALTVFGDVSAATVSLTAPAITITTPITGTTSVTLNATNGGISESAVIDAVTFVGSIITPLLTGSATGSVDLTGSSQITANNQINALGPFNASGRAFTLQNNGADLTVNGVTAATVNLSAPTINIPGVITGTTSVQLTATGGSIIESPNGSIVTSSFSASAANEGPADIRLIGAGNKIAASTGISAFGGDVVLVDDPTLLLTGNYIGNNLFFEVTLPGGSLQLGDAKTTAALNANQFGRISLVADGITV
ncbi:MAG TPA: filamentous hemagglutinin N-terminal domain-containing protein, partial [Acetobacteraceae bacterium]|nr:filamentous hemagglutinin N-terminal domain-containing protein [Acetobacteraceae bacterium]